MLKKLRETLLALHKDEGGADMVEYILLIALIGLPLIAVIWAFKDQLVTWLNDKWTELCGKSGI